VAGTIDPARRGPGRRALHLGTATLTNRVITRNKAKGGSAACGGLIGKALGGSVYIAGRISIDPLTVINDNSPDNCDVC
jgi:hypothetical protein